MKILINFLQLKVIVPSLLLLCSGCCVDAFKHRSIVEMNQTPGMIEGGKIYEWQKYVFDIKIIDEDNNPVPQTNLYNTLKQQEVSTHELMYGTSIGHNSLDGPGVSANVITGLWEEQTMKLPRGAVHIKIYMERALEDIDGELTPDSYKASAEYVCYTWAKSINGISLPSLLAELLKKEQDNWSKEQPLNIPISTFSLWDLKTNQSEGSSPLAVKVPLAPYLVGRYLVIPVEVQMKKADFESNCI
jgi:hypothetical protein